MQLEQLITPQEFNIHRVKEISNKGQTSSPGPQRSSQDGYNINGNRNEDLSNMQLKNASDRMNNVDVAHEEEIVRSVQGEEKQLKKRKQNIMNDVQIDMMENALQDEPDMQRKATSIQLWADKLSLHGSEVTYSQLKNWLNNRKAKLARAAAKVADPVSDSPGSPADEFLEPSSYGSQGTHQKETILRICGNESSETVSVPITTSSFKRQNGQYVSVVDGNGKEIGKGSIHLAKGIWFGINLQESGLCVVDVIDLKVDEKSVLPHPCDATGSSFHQAKMILGRMRILWESTNLLLIHQVPSN